MKIKKEKYESMLRQFSALLTDEHDMVANFSNTSAFLMEQLEDINWVGFYLYKDNELILGPFQGKVACMHIPIGKGVCGSSALEKRVYRVQDVNAFPGHIACDSASNSEIVIPLLKKDTLLGVLDIDSAIVSRFDEIDEEYLCQFADILIQSL